MPTSGDLRSQTAKPSPGTGVWAPLYLAALAGSVVVFNADAENAWAALALAAAGSVAVGLAVGRMVVAALALLTIPFSVPFGYADEYLGSDGPQVWWFGVQVALVSAALVLLTVWVKRRVAAPRPRA